MDPVRRQYETYPYPERDPAEERARLIDACATCPVDAITVYEDGVPIVP